MTNMNSEDLLAREEEFKKLNKELEKKTDSLMKQIENVMQKQDIFGEFTTNITKVKNTQTYQNLSVKEDCKEPAKPTTCICYKPDNGNEMQFLHAFVNVNVQTKILPTTFAKEKYTLESVCKFMASKIKLLQEQCDKLQANINKKISQCEAHLSKHAELESERMKLMNQTNNYKMEALDMKNKYAVLQNKLNEKERLHAEQRSETDALMNETRKLRNKNAALEAQCINQMDEIKRLKNVIESMKIAEREFRDSSRSHSASQRSAIVRLESNSKHLQHTIEKLQQLVDNLKEQNQLLSTDVLLQALERDYSKLLLSE